MTIRIRCLTQVWPSARRKADRPPPPEVGAASAGGRSPASAPDPGSFRAGSVAAEVPAPDAGAGPLVSRGRAGSPDRSGSGSAGPGPIGWPPWLRPARIIGPPCVFARSDRSVICRIFRLRSGLSGKSTSPASPPTAGHARVPGLAAVFLVLYLMVRSGEPPSVIGIDASQPARDVVRGAVLAAVVGGSGLALYIAAFHLGVSLNVVPEHLPAVWWRIPVLLLDALQNGLLEEVLVIGYLLLRLEQLGWRPAWAIACSALLRGTYRSEERRVGKECRSRWSPYH